MGDAGPDRSSVEVKALLRKLDPRTGSSHKDRVRLLNRFRNYAEGGGGGKGDVSFSFVTCESVSYYSARSSTSCVLLAGTDALLCLVFTSTFSTNVMPFTPPQYMSPQYICR